MKQGRFVLAVPRRRGVPPVVRRSASPDDVCDDNASFWTSDDTPEASLGTHGFLIGCVFSAQTARTVDAVPLPESESAQATAMRLVRNYWGAYVAILPDPGRRTLALLVDPSGMFPVYRRMSQTHVVFASDTYLLGEVLGDRLKVDWAALALFLRYPELRQKQTCLAGVEDLAPGTLLVTGGTQELEQPVWSASDYLPQGRAPSLGDAAAELRELATRTCGAWTDLLGPVAVATSGGVDSSFLCAALAAGDRDFGCITLATSDSSGDESDYARLLADHLDADFTRRVYDPAYYRPTACASAGLSRPGRKGFLTAVDALLAAGSAELGKAIVLDGNGGDNLFCFLHSAAPIVDRLRNEGPRAALFETLPDMCCVTGCDVPTMLRATGKRLMGGHSKQDWAPDSRLLADAAILEDSPVPLTPWHRLSTWRHPGKHDHLALIMRAQHHVHGFGPGPARFSPLMSQPLLEFCLGVPTWTWVKGGQNRALARAAFSDLLPRSVLDRTSKAGPDSFIRGAFDSHRAVLRDLLLDGLLAEQGVIDRAAVEQAFTLETSRRGSMVYRLLDLVEAENWSRSWG